MKRKATSQFILGGILLVFFVLFTWSLTFIDVQPIGPNGSSVAYARINKAVHNLFGVNMTLYNITDWAELKGAVKDDLSRLIYQKTKRKPMILPIIMSV